MGVRCAWNIGKSAMNLVDRIKRRQAKRKDLRGCQSCKDKMLAAMRAAAGLPPSISVCINAHNEGPRLRATIDAVRENLGDWSHEFIVVADEVTDGGCNGLGPGVTVIRNKKRRGCGRCKFQAIQVARGDVLIFLDAHQNVIAGRIADIAMAASREDSIFTPVIRNIAYDSAWRPQMVSHKNQIPNHTAMRFESAQYMVKPNPWVREHHLKEIRMVGVGFAISRKTLTRIGGFNAYHGLHGSQERGIGLRAYMAKVPVKLFGDLVLGHEFRAGKPRPKGYKRYTVRDQALNFWHAYFIVAGDRAFERMRRTLRQKARTGETIVKCADVIAERERFQRECKRRTDDELLEFLGLASRPSPTPKIDVRIAYEPGAKIGQDYNRIMRETVHEWVLLLDHDVLLLHPSWYEVCQRAISEHPDGGLFTCFTNNIGCKHQKDLGAPRGQDIGAHCARAKRLWEQNRYRCTLNSRHLIGGFFMLTSKTAWRKAGGFPEDGFFGVDNEYHRRIMKTGFKCYRMDGLYCYHIRDRKGGNWIDGVDTSATLARNRPRSVVQVGGQPGIRPPRCCIYTVITGDYDPLPASKPFPGWDYICLTDNANVQQSGPWQVRVFDAEGHGAREASRLPKILPHRFLAEYEYSLYHDANMRLVADPAALCDRLGWPDLAVPLHRYTNCVYGEADLMIRNGKAAPEGVRRAVARYREEGVPEKAGATENGVMLRRHNVTEVRRLMDAWWEEFLRLGLGRDQMAFAHACWRLGYKPLTFPGKARQQYLWGTHLHHKTT